MGIWTFISRWDVSRRGVCVGPLLRCKGSGGVAVVPGRMGSLSLILSDDGRPGKGQGKMKCRNIACCILYSLNGHCSTQPLCIV